MSSIHGPPTSLSPVAPDLNRSLLYYATRSTELVQQGIKYVYSDEFDDSPFSDSERNASRPEASLEHKDLPPQNYEPGGLHAALLRPDEERSLFRQMNCYRYQAAKLAEKVDPYTPDGRLIDRIDALLDESRLVRDQILHANLRLVVSLARKYSNGPNEMDELISDGNLVLMRAVDSFDYSRGFRFSTYATHAVSREFFRRYRQGRRRRDLELLTEPDLLSSAVECVDTEPDIVARANQAANLQSLMKCHLSSRDYEILTMRLGLDPTRKACTLNEVGARFGISKERVRQLQTRAIARIQTLARTAGD